MKGKQGTRGVKRLLAAFLCAVMVFVPMGTAYAEEETETYVQSEGMVQQNSDAPQEETMQQEADNCGIGVTFRLYKYKQEAQSLTVTMPQEYHKLSEYGFPVKDEDDPGYYTVLHALAEYEVQKNGIDRASAGSVISAGADGFVWDIEDYVSGSGMNDIGWNVWKNGIALAKSPAFEKLGQGDNVVFAAGWFYYNSSSGAFLSTSYCEFQSIPTDAAAGQQFEVTVSAVDTGNVPNPQGIRVSVLDKNGGEAASGVTDEAGKVVLRVAEPGTYKLTASRFAQMAPGSYYYDSKGGYAVDITIPSAAIQVDEGEQLSDEEAVDKVAEELEIPYHIEGDIVLPTEGNYGVQIKWSSSDASTISEDGTVTRPIMTDNTVKLTAQIYRGTEVQTKTYSVKVTGYELLESLLVTPGIMNTPGKYQKEYLVYVSRDAEQAELTVTLPENATMAMIDGSFVFGSGKQTKSIDLSAVKEGEQKELEVKVFLGQAGNGTVKVTLKKYGNPGEPLEELPNSWGQHLGGDDNNAVTDAKGPDEGGELLWESRGEEVSGWGTAYAGHPILVDGKIYVARNRQLQILDAATGKLVQAADLAGDLGFYSYPAYGEGKIFVPLGDGSVQCFNAATLEPLFLTAVPKPGMTGLSSIHYKDGMIYVGYTNGAWTDDALAGGFAAYETIDMDKEVPDELAAPVWVYEGNGSYYGMGAVTVSTTGGSYLVFAGDDGTVVCADPKTGEVKSKKDAGGKVRCALVYADGAVWFTSQDGAVHKFIVGTDGTLAEAAKAKLPSTTSSSPVVANSKVFVTGGIWQNGYLRVFDTDLNLLAEETFKGENYGPLNTPTVTTGYGNAYVYFTQNTSPDTLYVAKVGADNKITVTALYTSPEEHANYSMSNVIVAPDGTVYYGNDAGYLIAVKPGDTKPQPPDKEEEPEKEPEKTPDKTDSPTFTTDTTPLNTTAVRTLKGTASRKKAAGTDKKDLVKTIAGQAEEGKKSLTVTNVPDKLDAEVFEELAKHKDFRLILDFGTYTLSMKGSDVTDPSAVFTMRIKEIDNLVYEVTNEGPLPGKVTVVYQIPKSLESAENIYLYEQGKTEEAVQTAIKNGYCMFTLEKAGTYILSDEPADKTDTVEVNPEEEGIMPKEENKEQFPVWAVAAGGVLAGIVIGAAGTLIFRRRKRNKVWEE